MRPDDGAENVPKFGEEDDDNAAITAFWICGVRAREHRKGDAARIKDPYAERLMCDWAWERQQRLFRLDAAVVRRTSHYDDAMIAAVRDRGVRQLVAIGAGLDTRAFRLFREHPNMHVIEVDHPNMFAYKEPRLKDVSPACRRSIVPLEYDDVTKWDVRARELCGFDPFQPTIFVVEGVTMYIKAEDEVDLYKKIDENAADESIIVGCNLRMLNRAKSRDMGNGIVWYGTDRPGIQKVLNKWSITFKRLHWFDIFNSYLMMIAIKNSRKDNSADNSFMKWMVSSAVVLLIAIGISYVYIKL